MLALLSIAITLWRLSPLLHYHAITDDGPRRDIFDAHPGFKALEPLFSGQAILIRLSLRGKESAMRFRWKVDGGDISPAYRRRRPAQWRVTKRLCPRDECAPRPFEIFECSSEAGLTRRSE